MIGCRKIHGKTRMFSTACFILYKFKEIELDVMGRCAKIGTATITVKVDGVEKSYNVLVF